MYEKRFLIIAISFFLIILMVSSGVWLSHNREKASLSAFQAYEISNEIAETDYSQRVPPLSSSRIHSKPTIDDTEITNTDLLYQQTRTLIKLSDLSFEAREKSSGIILAAANALENEIADHQKEIISPQEKAILRDISNVYFSRSQLDEYKQLNELLDLLQNRNSDIDLQKVETLSLEAKIRDLTTCLATLNSPDTSVDEKQKVARHFFTTYPELANRLEEISGQNNENFFLFIEKELGQQVSSSSKK